MYPLFETVCIKNGRLQNPEWHEQRYRHAYKIFYEKNPSNDITKGIIIPEEFRYGLCKLRISYNETHQKFDFEKYLLKTVATLKLVNGDKINYSLKFTDRRSINDLYAMRMDCDDILIVKNGLITDSSYCNIVFFDGKEWYTPAAPLLKGTAREKLLAERMVREREIGVENLKEFICFKLVNAMRPFETVEEVAVKNIRH